MIHATEREGWFDDVPAHINSHWIVERIQVWLEAEALPFMMGVLATVDNNGQPASRTVAIREVTAEGLLFFTQSGSAKVAELSAKPSASFTFMLPHTQRQVTVVGKVQPLDANENSSYWETYDQERRLRFLVYGTKSGQPLEKQQHLDEELTALRARYRDRLPERPSAYVGYRIVPETVKFYQLNAHRLSDAVSVLRTEDEWTLQRYVP